MPLPTTTGTTPHLHHHWSPAPPPSLRRSTWNSILNLIDQLLQSEEERVACSCTTGHTVAFSFSILKRKIKIDSSATMKDSPCCVTEFPSIPTHLVVSNLCFGFMQKLYSHVCSTPMYLVFEIYIDSQKDNSIVKAGF
jgi:hypothetical protein